VLISVAAVSDFRPAHVSPQKHKRDSGTWKLELVPTEDILAELGKQKEHRVHVGFALETEDMVRNSRQKLRSKNLDWLVANPPEAVGSESGEYLLLGADGSQVSLGRLSKRELAAKLIDLIETTAASLPARGNESTEKG
jgi:phosphopantothenoylcysteine decarboxylase/phosphopantothenate--cysteine ligase